MIGFQVRFSDGEVEWWGGVRGTGGPEKKWAPDDPGPAPTLVVEVPELDFSKAIRNDDAGNRGEQGSR